MIGDRHEGGRRAEAALVLAIQLVGQPAVEHPVGHVARHFLRTNEHAFNFRIVD